MVLTDWASLPRVVLMVKNLPAMQEMQEMWVQSLGQEDPLEEEMVPYSSILAGRIPCTEEPIRQQSTWCKELDITEHQRTQHNLFKISR